jgi:predicted nucleotidyltransferase
METTKQIEIINAEFKKGLLRVLGEKLHAAYVYGAAAFNDSLPTGDIDFHVILNDHLTNTEKKELEDLHKELAEKYPPLGEELDGYYILLEDAKKKTPPQSEMWQFATDNAWALHRAHIRAGRYITLHGGDPREIYPPSTWSELEAALLEEIQFVEKHLNTYPDYGILNLCRLLYSFQTKDVVISKANASKWSFAAIPEWKWLVDLARKSYEGKATTQDRDVMVREARNFYAYATSQIEQFRQNHKGGTAKAQIENTE